MTSRCEDICQKPFCKNSERTVESMIVVCREQAQQQRMEDLQRDVRDAREVAFRYDEEKYTSTMRALHTRGIEVRSTVRALHTRGIEVRTV